LAGRPEFAAGLRVYASAEAHSSVEKAAMTLGLGRAGVRRIPVNDRFELEPAALAAAIDEDRAAGRRPVAIVATIGTTSSTSVDPVAAIADIATAEGLWLHVDAAYAGAVAFLPDRRGPFSGWERADSIVVNPHKWLFTPLDASLLLSRRMDQLQAAFSLQPEYLRTIDRQAPVRDYSEYQPQLGRRFRALKLWILIRTFGLAGLRARLEHHLAMAAEVAAWIDDDPDWERLAPVPFSTVCFRFNPPGLAPDRLDAVNAAIIDGVNRSGAVFLSHTRLAGRFTIRLAIGNLRTEERHLETAWALLRREATRVSAS
jgi:aromatic-L-amino-acid decarboxylase